MARTSEHSGATTRSRLLDAAERMFADTGFADTSMRAVTEAAGANIAAVNYHFGSKEGLLRAVVRRAMAVVNDERARVLDELEAAGEPTADDLVHAFVTTGAGLLERQGPRGTQVARFIGRVIFDPSPTMRELFATAVDDVEGRYLRALQRALPHLSPNQVAFRFACMIGMLGLHQTGALAGLAGGEASPVAVDSVVAFLVAGFRAPEPGQEPASATNADSSSAGVSSGHRPES
ncbi:TetR/AcrR family transcriptional regulator [Actinokineospora xionganensis]|uniref:TetR/AcrR family transcriptional regulator n=1 Tax=Actinokineospora xionganensis TaxID=2684470 RepID=A0ABR7L0L1_9PSEU|nr:TetR/AcrR family transcriptional regulator [Actinokineospora xionganensis]MBC6445969.1 TetR/AcrR family transcriptional regulator [Actinokineospora xionganensis]